MRDRATRSLGEEDSGERNSALARRWMVVVEREERRRRGVGKGWWVMDFEGGVEKGRISVVSSGSNYWRVWYGLLDKLEHRKTLCHHHHLRPRRLVAESLLQSGKMHWQLRVCCAAMVRLEGRASERG